MSARRSGIVKRTPKMPPQSAIAIVGRNGKPCQYWSMTSAGSVKMTPAARLSPAEAAVWTMLFSRMLCSRKSRSTAIEITAAGIDAETVRPTFNPRYAFAPARTAERIKPSTMALAVISGSDCEAGM